jgi:hypothetical protein
MATPVGENGTSRSILHPEPVQNRTGRRWIAAADTIFLFVSRSRVFGPKVAILLNRKIEKQ